MSTDFFGRQDSARAGSRLLVAGLVLALAAMAVAVHVVVTGVSLLLGGSASLLEPSPPAAAAIALIWATVALGGFFRWLDVRAGGATLARRFGAVPVTADARDARMRTLTGVVAEMAIAANCPPPDVFFLARDARINAFVVGDPARPAVAVSRGALERLERDELRAVVAHEIAHVVQGDLALNMRVLIVLGGLVALDEVGRTLIGEGPAPGEPRRFHPGLLVGWPLRALGSIGLFGASLIRSALSRRREFLADASAAQFSRQPFALASALATIRDADTAASPPVPHAREIAHLCFSAEARSTWYGRLLSSHPPLQSRIDALDPHTDVKRRKRAARGERVGPGARVADGAYADGIDGTGVDVNGSGVSDRILLMLPEGADCLAALCALFAGGDPIARRDYIGALKFAFDERLAARVKTLLPQIAGELEGDRLGLVEHATGVLRESVTRENRSRILLRLERLLLARGALDLGGYATLQLLRRKLDVEFPLVERIASAQGAGRGESTAGAASANDERAEGRRVKTFDAMGEEFALLLSLMVESSGAPDAVLDREFTRVLRCYTSAALPRRTKAERGIVQELERAFQTLYVQPKPIRRAFVEHCIEIMRADGHVARAERSLLALFAASLGCEELAA